MRERKKSTKPIPLKYCMSAIVPAELVRGDSTSQRYCLATGETVSFRYISGINDSSGLQHSRMSEECESQHGIPYSRVKKIWETRLGRLGGYWFKVKIIKEQGL